jgi:hypothetical protein
MRLLRLKEDGGLSLTGHNPDDIPPYAILSHRWGRNEDEITFQDLIENTGRNKLGYQKIIACGKQAAHDGLSFFWVRQHRSNFNLGRFRIATDSMQILRPTHAVSTSQAALSSQKQLTPRGAGTASLQFVTHTWTMLRTATCILQEAK